MRYVTRAGLTDYQIEGSATADHVFEADRTPIATGLLDANGVPLYRVPETVPLGFHVKPRVRVKAQSKVLA
jgi:hypothetical protein